MFIHSLSKKNNTLISYNLKIKHTHNYNIGDCNGSLSTITTNFHTVVFNDFWFLFRHTWYVLNSHMIVHKIWLIEAEVEST